MNDESVLIQRSLEGDERAYRALYENHVGSLYRFLTQFSRDRHEVEEWVQRSFIKAFLRLESFRSGSRFATWLFSIGINEMKADGRRKNIFPLEGLEDAGTPVAENREDQFHWDELMKSWLAKLDDQKRAVFVLHEVEGYSHAEIADILGIGESSSRTILTRTRHWLRDRWNDERKEAG